MMLQKTIKFATNLVSLDLHLAIATTIVTTMHTIKRGKYIQLPEPGTHEVPSKLRLLGGSHIRAFSVHPSPVGINSQPNLQINPGITHIPSSFGTY